MRARASIAIVVCGVVIVAACHKKGAPDAASSSKHCAASVSVPSSLEPAPSAPPIASSRVPVTISIDGAMARKLLESKVPTRVAASNGESVGALGTLKYTVDRGPFAIGVDAAGAIVATTELSIHASVCHDVIALGCVQYASCSPSARVVASVPTKLTKAYRFPGSNVRIDVTKRCYVTAADIDATSYVESAAARELPKIKAKIDGSLPDLKPDVAKAWDVAQETVPFAGACLALRPTSIVEGLTKMDHDAILLRLAIVASPSVDLPCAGDAPKSPLPDLAYDAGLDDAIELHVPLRAAPSFFDGTLKKKLAAAPATLGGDAITAIATAPTKDAFAFDVSIDGETCGVARFLGAPRWDDHARALAFSPLKPVGHSIDGVALADVVAIAPPVDDERLATALSDLAPLASAEGREIALAFDSHGNEGTFVTPAGIEARFFLKGRASVTVK